MGALRLLLALSVVIAHGFTNFLGFRLIDAAGAVWVFFAISGFLITIALDQKYASGKNHLLHFYWNRALRLYPSYWVWLALTIAAYTLLPHSFFTRGFHEDGSFQASGFWLDHIHLASIGTIAVALIANISGLFADSLLSLGFDKASGALVADPLRAGPIWAMAFVFIGQYWSIGVELCFYALAPLLTRGIAYIAGIFLLSASGLAQHAWTSACGIAHVPPAVALIRAPQFLWIFMAGAALAHAYLAKKKGKTGRFRISVAACVAMAIFVAVRRTVLFTNPAFPWWEFVGLVAAIPFLFAATGRNRIDRFLGELSYPVYVNHFLIIQVASSFFAPNGALYSALSIAIATATVVWIERPTRAWKFGAGNIPAPKLASQNA